LNILYFLGLVFTNFSLMAHGFVIVRRDNGPQAPAVNWPGHVRARENGRHMTIVPLFLPLSPPGPGRVNIVAYFTTPDGVNMACHWSQSPPTDVFKNAVLQVLTG
jgi:hypothetical protein